MVKFTLALHCKDPLKPFGVNNRACSLQMLQLKQLSAGVKQLKRAQ